MAGSVCSQQTYSFSYTGGVQTLTVLAGNWGIQCWGATGGSVNTFGGGGKGGYSEGAYNVLSNGTTLNILVGGKGNPGTGNTSAAGAGGWNGGGGGAAVGYSGGGGGGATDVRVTGMAATDRVIVAGGGGGAAYYAVSPNLASGGNGGGQVGQNGDIITSGGIVTIGGGGAGANGGSPGLATVGTANGTSSGGGGGGSSAGTSIGQPGTGGGAGGAAGPSSSGSTGSAGGGGGGYAGGAGGVQTSNAGVAGAGGSGYVGGVTNGITAQTLQPGYIPNPDPSGHGYVILTRLCDLQITASKNPICAGESIVIGSNAGSNIVWNTGANTPSITVSPSVTTGYTVSGVSSSSLACTSTVSILVKVNSLPALAAYSFPPVICEGGSGMLGASGASTYTWSNGNTGASVPVTPLLSSVFTVTGTSTEGCVNTQTVAVTVNTSSLSVTQNTTVCKGSSVKLTADGVSSAMWSNGASFLTISVSPSVTTLYTVSGTDAIGCLLSNSVTVTVLNLPVVTISASKQIVCRGESVVLTANGGVSYVWDNAETGTSVTKTLPVNVPYQYSVIGTDVNGCKSSAMITVNASACTGVAEVKANQILVFPNPVNSELTISGGNNTMKVVMISDLHGKTLMVEESDDSNITVNVESLPAGVYYIQVKENDENTIHKFIKL